MGRIKSVIFDFDGVINGLVIQAFKMHQIVARQLGLAIPSIKLVRQNWYGPWSTEIVPRLARKLKWPKKSVSIFIKTYRRKINDEYGFKTTEKTKKMIKNLFENGILLTIVSSRSSGGLRLGLEKLEINDFFIFVQGKEDCRFQKPNPKALTPTLEELKKRGVDISEVVFIGDNGVDDFQAAKNYKPPINFIGILSGSTKRKEFEDSGLERKFILSINQIEKLPEVLEMFDEKP